MAEKRERRPAHQWLKRIRKGSWTSSIFGEELAGSFDELHATFVATFDGLTAAFVAAFDGLTAAFVATFDELHATFVATFDALTAMFAAPLVMSVEAYEKASGFSMTS